METKRLLAGLIALLVLALPAIAQTSGDTEKESREAEKKMRDAERQMRDAERQMREAARVLARFHADKEVAKIDRRVVVFDDHARLGVVLRSEADPKTDSIGAYLEALSPGSPAEEAGLRPGDIITKFNSQALAATKGDEDEEESAPAAKLTELAGSLKDGDKVTLEYKRGTETKTATVIARRLLGTKVKVLAIPSQPLVEMPELPNFDMDLYGVGHQWQDIDMVALNAELGEYFGTAEGILVVRVHKDNPLKLRGGDVILAIGDRKPTTPSQAMRIIRSYEPGESVALQLMRKREKVTLSVQVPPRQMGWWPSHNEAPEAPISPASPAHPAQPAPAAAAAPPPPPKDL